MYIIVDPHIDNRWLQFTLNFINGHLSPEAHLYMTTQADAENGTDLCYGVNPKSKKSLFIPRYDTAPIEGMVFRQLDTCCGLQENILIHRGMEGHGPRSRNNHYIDFFYNIFAYISCLEEWQHELTHGPAHSYALRLNGDKRRFDRPWADLLVQALCSFLYGKKAKQLIRKTPPTIFLTHDVDALSKTGMSVFKDTIFRTVNALRAIARHELQRSSYWWRKATSTLFSQCDYNQLKTIAELEKRHNFKSTFLAYGFVPTATLGERAKQMLFDPGYNLQLMQKAIKVLRQLDLEGFEIGCHLGFDAWKDIQTMSSQKHALEATLNRGPLHVSRQHWLKFSLHDTWRSLEALNVSVDATLGFNDRPGFRAGTARPFLPWDHARSAPHKIMAIPTVLMDSHLFHYADMPPDERDDTVKKLFKEIALVSGASAIIWHPHTLANDYGWRPQFERILIMMEEEGFHSMTMSEGLTNRISDDGDLAIRPLIKGI